MNDSPLALTDRHSTIRMVSPPPVLEKGPNSTVTIKITVSDDDTLMWFEKAAKDFAKVIDNSFDLSLQFVVILRSRACQGVDIKGFRRGSSIPTQIVVAQIGAEAVKSKAVSDLTDLAMNMVKQQVPLVGQYVIEGGGEHSQMFFVVVVGSHFVSAYSTENSVVDRYNPGRELTFAIKVRL